MATGVRIEESDMSRKGQSYITAGDGRIPNQGQQSLRVVTNEGKQGNTCYHICNVNRPLTSITQTCDAGIYVICTSDGGYIYSLIDGSYTRFERHSNTYELDLRLTAKDASGNGGHPGFTRQGQ